jgi:hypothetical protein
LQRPDGGWAQTRFLSSDAWDRLALRRFARQAIASTAVYQRGARFLLASQNRTAHGIASRAPKLQPYFQSGFPHGHDQWISAAAPLVSGSAVEAVEPARNSAVCVKRGAGRWPANWQAISRAISLPHEATRFAKTF